MELQVEVLRGETVQVHRGIPQQCPGQDGPVLQGGAVQERLQDASRTSRGSGDVHFRSMAGPQGGSVPHIGDRLAAAVVQDHGRQVRRPGEGQFVRPPGGRILHLPLEGQVDAGARFLPAGLRFHQLPGQVGQGIGRVRQRFRQGRFQGRSIQEPAPMQPFQQTVPLGQQLVPGLAGMDGGRRVGEDGQGGGFGPGEFRGRAPEIAPGGRFQPHDIAAERGMGGIQGQDFILGAAEFQPGGQDGFHHLLPNRPLPVPGQADDLHRQRTAAAHDVPRAQVVHGGADQRDRIHARVPPEMPVLELDEGGRKPVRDGVAGREPPLLVLRDAGAQQFTVPVGDDRRIGRTLKKVLRQAEQPACQKDLEKNQECSLPAAHRVTAVVLDSVLAETCGLYIAEQVMVGRMYEPS